VRAIIDTAVTAAVSDGIETDRAPAVASVGFRSRVDIGDVALNPDGGATTEARWRNGKGPDRTRSGR
jgi:hypothetical protein